MPEKACEECGKLFTYKATQERHCCSQSCAAKLRNRRLKAEGRLYQPVKPRRGVEAPCLVCGMPVYRNASQIAKGVGQYCSPACHNVAQTKPAVVKACANCGKEMRLKPSQTGRVYCTRACETKARTKRNMDRMHNGKPARHDAKGYVLVWQPDHPNRSMKGWQLEHRLIAEAMLGRYLQSSEHVHHINGIKDDNRPENLEVMDANDHAVLSATDYRDKLQRERDELEEYRKRYGPLTLS